ncbi:MAG: phosphatase PAP2 family protein [bacterium]|jgi:membrane-associated phospholipid phosphatase
MRKLFSENRVFVIAYLIMLIIALALKLIYTKEELFLAVNLNHNTIADHFFKLMTHVGDGFMFIAIVIILLFVEYRKAVLAFSIYLISSQITQFLKRVVFENVPRPKKYFEGIQDLHLIDGVQVHNMMSFPSGHTTSAFALATFLTIISKNKNIGFIYLILAILIGYSRMYLAQHFYEDVMMGSIIGILSSFVTYYFLLRTDWYNNDKLNYSLINRNYDGKI